MNMQFPLVCTLICVCNIGTAQDLWFTPRASAPIQPEGSPALWFQTERETTTTSPHIPEPQQGFWERVNRVESEELSSEQSEANRLPEDEPSESQLVFDWNTGKLLPARSQSRGQNALATPAASPTITHGSGQGCNAAGATKSETLVSRWEPLPLPTRIIPLLAFAKQSPAESKPRNRYTETSWDAENETLSQPSSIAAVKPDNSTLNPLTSSRIRQVGHSTNMSESSGPVKHASPIVTAPASSLLDILID